MQIFNYLNKLLLLGKSVANKIIWSNQFIMKKTRNFVDIVANNVMDIYKENQLFVITIFD